MAGGDYRLTAPQRFIEPLPRLPIVGVQIVFKVRSDATKADVRRAVELLFEVKVDRVSVVRMPSKVKRFGTRAGARRAWKKAYVRLAAGQSIDFMGAE